MSAEVQRAMKSTAPATGGAVQKHDSGHGTMMRGDLREMSYTQGVQALTPRDGAPRVVQMLPGDTVPTGAALDTERPIGGTVATDIRQRLITTLRQSARTVSVLDALAAGGDWNLIWSGGGTGQVGNAIQIDRRWTFDMWLTSMTHELTHLLDDRQGREPEAATATDRDAFVATKVQNEANAHAAQYAAHWELIQAGSAPAYEPNGYSPFMTHFATLGQTAGAATIEAAARPWLTTQYRSNPMFTTSNTSENYYTYWGRIWDEAHPAAGH